MELFDSTIKALDAALGESSLRQQVISNNIANINTPNFRRSEVGFDGELERALSNSEAGAGTRAFEGLQPHVTADQRTTLRADGNNVDVDMEMADLAENNVRYNALVQLAGKQMEMLRYVISDGRR